MLSLKSVFYIANLSFLVMGLIAYAHGSASEYVDGEPKNGEGDNVGDGSYQKLEFIGDAFDMDSNRLLYSEHHEILLDRRGKYLKSTVRYRDAAENLIATKTLDYSPSQVMPELEFTDLRTNSGFVTQNMIDSNAPKVHLRSYVDGVESNYKVKVDKEKVAITDAGFDTFVAQNWDDLVAGKKLTFNFLALTRAEYFGFQLRRTDRSAGKISFVLEPSSFLIRLLMAPINLTYDIETKRLLEFEGLTNIERVSDGKAEGENYVARIEYRYLSPDIGL